MLSANIPRSSAPPGLVILQAGCATLAAAGAMYFWQRDRRESPTIGCVQPVTADGLRESVFSESGELRATREAQNSIMALLNCAMPSLIAWPVLRSSVPLFFSIDDP